MKIETMPKKAAAELLSFIAENESFATLATLGDSVTVPELQALLREMATQLHVQADAEPADSLWQGNPHLSRKAKQLISTLSSTEEKALVKAFDIND